MNIRLHYDNIKFKKGFSLAEMLLVLLILSFLIVSLAPIAYKQIPKKTDRSSHGRFECYYEGDQLMEYTADEIYGPTTPKAVTKCEFNPPASSSFFIIQAIGGGAGGTYITEDPDTLIPTSESGYINAPKSGEAYTQNNCTVSEAGDIQSGVISCPTWIKSIWNNYPPTVTLEACASGGSGGVGIAKRHEDNSVVRSKGGNGGKGACTRFQLSPPMDVIFKYEGSTKEGDVTIQYPNGSCVLGGGTNGADSTNPLINGSNGYTGTTTCSPIVSYKNGGAGVEGCFPDEECEKNLGEEGSFSLTNVSYRRQGTKASTKYGYMGNTGEYQSMFFPGLNDSLEITVGKGGAAGTSITSPAGGDGEDTSIKLKNSSDTTAILAKGGKGTNLGGSYTFWLKGGAPVDTGSADASARFAVASGFNTFIEIDSDSKMPTKLPEQCLVWEEMELIQL